MCISTAWMPVVGWQEGRLVCKNSGPTIHEGSAVVDSDMAWEKRPGKTTCDTGSVKMPCCVWLIGEDCMESEV